MADFFSWSVPLFFGLAAASGYAFTWLARVIAPRVGLLDRPDRQRKFHRRPTPLLGGVGVCASFLFAMHVIVPAWFAASAPTVMPTGVLLSASCFCLLGLLDDKFVFRARTKLLGQVLASLPFALGTPELRSVQLFGCELPLGMLGTGFTVFWLVACANIINLMDGLDGLASMIGFLTTLAITCLSLINGNVGVAVLSVAVAGSLLGFLVHNWPPARIFLGDAGSLTIGFLVGALAFDASTTTDAVFSLTLPAVILSIPAFDTFMAILRRKLNGRGIGEGDRGHIHHRLQDRGCTRLQTLLVISGLCLAMAVAAVAAARVQNDWLAVGACLAILTLIIAGRLFGDRELLLALSYLRAVSSLLGETAGSVRTRLVLARLQSPRSQLEQDLWGEVCRQLPALGATSLEVACLEGAADDSRLLRRWRAASTPRPSGASTWTLQYTTAREDGRRVRVRGTGQTADGQAPPHADDLFRLFHAASQHAAPARPAVALTVVPVMADTESITDDLGWAVSPPSEPRLRHAA